MGTARVAASLVLLWVGAFWYAGHDHGRNQNSEVCKCPSETHGHEAGKCNNLATEPDHMCRPCHDKAAEEMPVARPPDHQPPSNQPRR
jgi:hypothetical protein